MKIKDIKGDLRWDYIHEIYEGKPGDSCNAKEIIEFIYNFYKKSFTVKTLDKLIKPKLNDIICIKINNPEPDFTIIWSNGSESKIKNKYAITFPRQKKIILTYPLHYLLTSEQTLAHELGHWFFDRFFDDIIPYHILRGSDDNYKKYSAASAYCAEEKKTGNKKNCKKIPINISFHKEGCELLRKYEDERVINIPKRLCLEYKEKWENKM